MKNWQMQEAKQHFSKLVRKSWTEGPQKITYRVQKQEKSIVDFFQNSPHRDIELVLERREDTPRDIKL